ncbi:MAG TPA: DUF2877 domain-containing protein [Chloroflexota bacterium]|nr:DUF2877 domain-containing protein [Chloroflexota bacterium]
MSIRESVTASLIGEKALALLESPAFWGRVNAVVTNAVYLQGMGGELLWIGPTGHVAHRRCLQVPLGMRQVPGGTVFRNQGRRLLLGEGLSIDWAGAQLWRPERIRPDDAIPLPVLAANLVSILESVIPQCCSDGLAQAMPFLRALLPDTSRPSGNGTNGHTASCSTTLVPRESSETNPLIPGKALGAVSAVADACIHHDGGAMVQAGRGLVGLGPGLTPSGDDYLGAVLFALSQMDLAYPGLCRWRLTPSAELVDMARSQTNWISHTLMSDMAEGHAAEPLHRFVLRVLRDPEPGGALDELPGLLEIGHSSGWDMLTGALTGMLASIDPGLGL